MDLQTALTGFQTKQRKILEPVDHQKIQYEAYRKNFYVEVPELARMTPEGIVPSTVEVMRTQNTIELTVVCFRGK